MIVVQLPPKEILQRRILYDVMVDGERASRLVGLAPVSEDVEEYEERDSVLRSQRVAGMLPLVATMADWMAEAIVAVQAEDDEMPEYAQERIFDIYRNLIRTTSMTTLSQLADLGMFSAGGAE